MDTEIEVKDRTGETVAIAIVDTVDAHLVVRYTWRLLQKVYRGRTTSRYAIAWIDGRAILLHRLLMSAPAHLQVDHVDGNGLNNRRTNLRLVTSAEQMQNKRSYSGSTSCYRGVHWSKQRSKWRAEIRLNGKNTFLGHFDDEKSAAVVAANARQRLMTHAVEGR